MKLSKIIALLTLLLICNLNFGQVSVNVNIGTPPKWAPETPATVEYYYIPDVQAYYDIRQTQFIYFGNGKWKRSKNLPYAYRNYNLYSGYKVILNDYHGPSPYNYYKQHKVKYYKGYNGKPQKVKYYKNHDNGKHEGKEKHNKDNNGNGKHKN